MRVLVYGAGAVGCYLGGHLALGGHEVVLLGRQPLVDAIGSGGLHLSLADGSHHIQSIAAVSTLPAALEVGGSFDWIAFTMKAYDVVPAIFDLQAHLSDSLPVVSFQNGVGSEDSLRDAFGAEHVGSATLTTAVSMSQPGIVVEERRRGVAIAADSPVAPSISAAFAGSLLDTRMIAGAASLKWSKLLLNMMANATCAILDWSPAQVYADRRLFAIERAALLEALIVMKWLDLPAVNLPGAPAALLARVIRTLPPFFARLLLRARVGSGRGDKLPSLQMALRAGQRRTEVAWLNGAVAGAADRLDRMTPVNHALALIVSDIAGKRAPWEMYRHKPDLLLSAVRATQ